MYTVSHANISTFKVILSLKFHWLSTPQNSSIGYILVDSHFVVACRAICFMPPDRCVNIEESRATSIDKIQAISK